MKSNKVLLIPLVCVGLILIGLMISLSTSKPTTREMTLNLPEPLASELPAEGTYLLNFFASWCVPCLAEHRVFMQEAQQSDAIPLYGVAYKDEDSARWLRRFGNPYEKVIDDRAGDIALTVGMSGVPTTYIIKDGVIRYRHAGAVDEYDYEKFQELIAGF